MTRIHLVVLTAFMLALSCGKSMISEKGFEPLFNGRDMSGWNVAPGWKAEKGELFTSGANATDLFTREEYGNYILRLEYKLSKVGNSGVLVRFGREDGRRGGFEVQLLAPWTPYRDDLHCTGSMYGHVPVTNRPDETTGVWHSMEIVCDRRYVVVSVNGAPSSWTQMDQVPSLRDKNLAGLIGFQGNHSDSTQWVRFRNVRIRDLDREPDYVLRGFGLTDSTLRKLNHRAAVSLGLPVVPGLCEVFATGDSVAAPAAGQALFAVAAELSAPEKAGAERDSLLGLLKGQAAKAEKEEVRGYLEWLAGMLGK